VSWQTKEGKTGVNSPKTGETMENLSKKTRSGLTLERDDHLTASNFRGGGMVQGQTRKRHPGVRTIRCRGNCPRQSAKKSYLGRMGVLERKGRSHLAFQRRENFPNNCRARPSNFDYGRKSTFRQRTIKAPREKRKEVKKHSARRPEDQ